MGTRARLYPFGCYGTPGHPCNHVRDSPYLMISVMIVNPLKRYDIAIYNLISRSLDLAWLFHCVFIKLLCVGLL